MALREILVSFGFDVDTSALEKGKKLVDIWTSEIKKVGGSLSLGQIKGWTDGVVGEVKDAAAGIRKAAALSGLGVEEVQQWGFAGIGPETLGKAFRGLSKTMAGVDDGAKSATKSFAAIGVSAKDADGDLRPVGDVFTEVGEALANLESPAQRAALGQRIFGKAAAEVLPVFAKGGPELAKLRERFKQLGGGISGNTLKNMKDMAKAQKELSFATLGLKSELVGALAPGLTEAATWFGNLIGKIRELSQRSNIFRVAALALGGVMVAVGLRTYAAWLPWIALALLVALVIDDIWTGLEGGDSVFGAFINWVSGGTDAMRNFRDAFKIGGVLGALAEGFSQLGGAIVYHFINGLEMMWNPIANFAEKINAWQINLATSVASWFAEVGRAIIQGIIKGAQEDWADLQKFVEDLAAKLPTWIKGPLGIHSPSSVFADIGENIFEGLDRGMTQGASSLSASQANNVTINIAGSASAAVVQQGVVDGLGASYDFLVDALVPSVD